MRRTRSHSISFAWRGFCYFPCLWHPIYSSIGHHTLLGLVKCFFLPNYFWMYIDSYMWAISRVHKEIQVLIQNQHNFKVFKITSWTTWNLLLRSKNTIMDLATFYNPKCLAWGTQSHGKTCFNIITSGACFSYCRMLLLLIPRSYFNYSQDMCLPFWICIWFLRTKCGRSSQG